MDFIKNALNSLSPVAGFQPAFQRAIDSRQAPAGRLNSAANVRLLMAEKARQARLNHERVMDGAGARKKAATAPYEGGSFFAEPSDEDFKADKRASLRYHNQQARLYYALKDKVEKARQQPPQLAKADAEALGNYQLIRDKLESYNRFADNYKLPLPRVKEYQGNYNAFRAAMEARDAGLPGPYAGFQDVYTNANREHVSGIDPNRYDKDMRYIRSSSPGRIEEASAYGAEGDPVMADGHGRDHFVSFPTKPNPRYVGNYPMHVKDTNGEDGFYKNRPVYRGARYPFEFAAPRPENATALRDAYNNMSNAASRMFPSSFNQAMRRR